MKSPAHEAVSQLLWVLFSDANSRFNTLIEECAHLQDTIVGLTSDPGLVKEILDAHPSREQIRGFARVVVCDPKRAKRYYDASVRDRAFISLWNSLGAVIKGLDSNQKQHEKGYAQVVREVQQAPHDHARSQALYWYLSLRGYFLNPVFLHYTAQLEHAHEKLIQMLENQAGILPNPILLRRWNSGAYGEFLSEYSRHVNWEARTCVERVNQSANRLARDELGKQQSAELFGPTLQSITHTWTHYPTSLTKYFDVNLASDTVGAAPRAQRFAIIRSAYFYLEQPVLFPLLYHECVHINFPDNAKVDHHYKSFFGARLATNQSLRLAKFPVEPPTTYENFWDHFTEEVWADAMSVALGGRAYLLALALQLLGLSGSDEFNHYRADDDTMYPLDQLGGLQHRKYEVSYPSLDMAYFWEARLLVACDVTEQLEQCRGKAESKITLEMVGAVRELIFAWRQSGHIAFADDATSVTHASFWRYREELNDWVVKTVMQNLQPVAGEKLLAAADVCSTYQLSSASARRCIEDAVNSYRTKYFQQSQGVGRFQLEPNHRLENVAVDVRWAIARDVVREMRHDPGQISRWTGSFANWMRNDGGAAFRIALEAARLRLSLMDGLADLLDGKNLPGASSHVAGVWAELSKLKVDHLRNDPESRRKLLRRRGITNSESLTHRSPADRSILEGIDAIVDKILDPSVNASSQYRSCSPADCVEVHVGTLSFGVIRPDEFRLDEQKSTGSAYLDGLAVIRRYMAQSVEAEDAEAKVGDASHLASSPAFTPTFLPLVGEYQFLSFTKGSTPVERDAHPGPFVPRMLIKPRLVLLVGGVGLSYDERKQRLWARVALIRFKYRWQWSDLKQRLEEKRAQELGRLVEYSLFISSAWEDVVLVTWHASPEAMWAYEDLGVGIGRGDGIDSQSTYIVPQDSYRVLNSSLRENDATQWLSAFQAWAASAQLTPKIYRRSGRYDYTVVWRTASEGLSDLEACTAALASMPERLWKQVHSMITSYEQPTFEPDHPNQGSKLKAVTHFAIKDL